MENISENEQWKLRGDCTKCRRKNYCSKPCTRCNRAARLKLTNAIAETLDVMTGGAMSELIEKFVYGKF